MKQLSFHLATMTALEKAGFAQNVASALIVNASKFPDQPIAAADLHDFAAALKQTMANAERARASFHELMSAQLAMLPMLEGYLAQVAAYVEKVSAGDAATLELAGLNLPELPWLNAPPCKRTGQLATPAGLRAVATRRPGLVVVSWRKVRNARNYIVQYAASEAVPEKFTNEESVACTSFCTGPLPCATKYWFRVAALGTTRPSEWTESVSVVGK